SVMDYIFRRLALDHLSYDQRAELGILSVEERSAVLAGEDPAASSDELDPGEPAQSVPVERAQPQCTPPAGSSPPPHSPPAPDRPPPPHGSAGRVGDERGRPADAPLGLNCGTKMRPAGSCYVCEGCGSTSGCS